ncbi:zf-HC2 domain-containing protein [Candidatus Eisenbacteria bacterium]|uniref:Zf-HC2 domain-containing protein n=1 Tax=Eiseniibacteriota bacterium TaxID=2212470 RepID=A0ABV6YKD8_UNCEI
MSDSCPWVQTRLARYLDGELHQGDCARVEKHLEDCPGCQAMAASLRQQDALIRDTALSESATEHETDQPGFETRWASLQARFDLEAAERLRRREVEGGESRAMSPGEVVSEKLEDDLARSAGTNYAGTPAETFDPAAQRGDRTGPRPERAARRKTPARSFLSRLFIPGPAWRWINLTGATAVAAAITVILLVNDPDLPNEAMRRAAPKGPEEPGVVFLPIAPREDSIATERLQKKEGTEEEGSVAWRAEMGDATRSEVLGLTGADAEPVRVYTDTDLSSLDDATRPTSSEKSARAAATEGISAARRLEVVTSDEEEHTPEELRERSTEAKDDAVIATSTQDAYSLPLTAPVDRTVRKSVGEAWREIVKNLETSFPESIHDLYRARGGERESLLIGIEEHLLQREAGQSAVGGEAFQEDANEVVSFARGERAASKGVASTEESLGPDALRARTAGDWRLIADAWFYLWNTGEAHLADRRTVLEDRGRQAQRLKERVAPSDPAELASKALAAYERALAAHKASIALAAHSPLTDEEVEHIRGRIEELRRAATEASRD